MQMWICGRAIIVRYWIFCAFVSLSLFTTAAQAQTVNRFTNTNDSTVGEISGATTCSVSSAFQRNFTVTSDFSVQDVNLGLLTAHNTRSDINIFLRSPVGTIVTATTTIGGNADNFNVLLDDQAAANIDTHFAADAADAATVVPPYQRTFRPTNALNSTFFGQSAAGTWTLFICDGSNDGVNGTFYQADLYLTSPAASADLSLLKTVASGSPSTAVFTLTVTNSSGSTLTAAGVTVRDILPAGTTFSSASGTGTYNSGTGIWTLGTSIAPGQSRSIDITVNVTAASGTTITNIADIITSSQTDPDSTPNNGVTTEDDYSSRAFTVGGRIAGVAPNINSICSAAGTTTTILDWNTQSWTSGSSTGSANVTALGTVNFAVATQGTYNAPLALTLDNTGGFGSAGLSLFQSIEYSNISQVTTTTVTLPTAVPGMQFRVFDVDFAAADFADRLVVTGTYQGGAPFNATLTNGVVNLISGNAAIGDGGSAGTSSDGNVVATFSAPVDTVTIVYGNHTTAPADPDGQAISIHDFTFCRPVANLSVTKVSTVVSDGVSATNPKALPAAIVRYCILVSNAGSATATNIAVADAIPATVTYVPGSLLSGANCASAATAEDDNAAGADESDPVGVSVAGTTLTGSAPSLNPAAAFAIVFNATVN